MMAKVPTFIYTGKRTYLAKSFNKVVEIFMNILEFLEWFFIFIGGKKIRLWLGAIISFLI